jgi:hypothetical protein
VIKFRCEYVQIEVEDAILTGSIVHVLVDLVFVLYADHTAYETALYRRFDIVADITGEIGEFPCIALI